MPYLYSMKTITLTSSDKKIDLLLQVAKEMGVKTTAHYEVTDEEMALPGPKVSKQQLETWLAKDDGDGGYTSAQMKERIKKRKRATKPHKNGSNL